MTIHQNKGTTMQNLTRAGVLALILTASASCNTDVVNPGPVDDKYVDRSAATAMVNGSGRALGSAINWIAYTGASVTREIHPAGSTGSFGITNLWQRGQLLADDADLNTHWENAQRARWLAEEAVRRLEDAGPPGPNDVMTVTTYVNALRQAYVYAGFANRLLGENMCDGVIDGSGILPNAIYFTRAESLFTKAIALAGGTAATTTNLNTAAQAGRASARMYRGDWTNAVTDAAAIASTYTYNISYFNVGEDAQRNRVFYSSGNTRESGSAYRAHTQWSTWHLQYKYGGDGKTLTAAMRAAPVMNDPRIDIVIPSTATGDAAIECCGIVPFWPQNKYISSASAIRLTSGREMLLIRAEAALRGTTDPTAGMALLNQARTAAGAPTITAVDITDAWRLLKRERGIELWLEARRVGDRRRWAAAGTAAPGAFDPYELPGATYPGTTSHLDPAVHNPTLPATFCFPVSRSEKDTNPNI